MIKRDFTSLFILVLTGVIFSSEGYSQEAKIPCLKKNGEIGLNTFDKFDCSLSKAVVNDPKIKESFKSTINESLAEKLASKATQRLEEITVIDRYFDQIKLELLMNSKDVEDKCRLDVIATPKCGKETSQKDYQAKLGFLLDKYPLLNPKNPNDPRNDSLANRMRAKMGELRGAGQVKVNQCPIDGAYGHFSIESQFSQKAAEDFLMALKNDRSEEIAKFYSTYPQFQMIKDAAKLGNEGALFVQKFEEEMKKYRVEDGSGKAFMEKIFFSESTQKNLAKVLANKCEGLTKNIEEYLCKDFDHLGMTEEFASDFFTGDDYEIDEQIAKGFSCELQDVAAKNPAKKVFTNGDTVASWNEKFTSDMRLVPAKMDITIATGSFCDLYTCQSDRVKSLPSCKNGGPVKSEDMLKLCLKNQLNDCDLELQKQISYLKTIETDEEVVKSSRGLASGVLPNGEAPKTKSFSSFYQNFVGVEGTLLAEGKKITPTTIAEKQAEFVEKKLEPTMGTLTALSANSNRQNVKTDAQTQVPAGTSASPIARSDEKFNTFVTSSNNANEEFRRNLVFNNMKGGSDSASAKAKKGESEVDSTRLEEMKKLRTELNDVINGLKGSESEKLATVADNNRSILSPKGYRSDDAGRISITNQAEKERLEQYRENLNSWESKLRGWQNQLTDREFNRGSGGNSGSNSGGADSRRAPASVADEYNNSTNNDSNSGANSLKLSKVNNAAGAINANGKGEAGTEKASGSEEISAEGGIVNSENLSSLRKESLKTLGIVASDSFIIKVRHLDKVYDIPVKTFTYNGKNMFVPLLNERNRELAKIVYNSPLFEDYRQYQADKDKNR